MTPALAPAAVPVPAPPVDIGALWRKVTELAEGSPREQAMVDAFEPVSWAGGTLSVRRARGGSAAAGSAIVDMLQAVCTRAAGVPVRVRVEAESPAPRVQVVAAPVPAQAPVLPGRPASLRDDPVATHPLVREVSALFDATIVRIEAAGTLAPDAAAEATRAPETSAAADRDDEDHADHLLHGEHDV